MSHIMVVGQTLSGKSTLAKILAANYRKRGIGVIVLDPVYDNGWECDYKTADIDEFLGVYWKSRQCAAFIDEAGEFCKTYDMQAIKTATRGRHCGHRNHYISQRATMIARTIRDQCTDLFLFNSGMEDCKIHARDWNCIELKTDGPFLKTGEYLHKRKMGELTRGRLF